MAIDSQPLLEIRGLRMHFPITEGIVLTAAPPPEAFRPQSRMDADHLARRWVRLDPASLGELDELRKCLGDQPKRLTEKTGRCSAPSTIPLCGRSCWSAAARHDDEPHRRARSGRPEAAFRDAALLAGGESI
jgi:hypothetical protein